MNPPDETPNLRILVIDDNAAIHSDFRKILCGSSARQAAHDEVEAALFDEPAPGRGLTSFEIGSAYQGQDGLSLVQEALGQGRPYAMAFVDVRMPPGWDGIETIRHIWQSYPDLQVVICTAYSDYSWDDIVKQLGKSDSLLILKKPFDNVEVLQLAHALTKKWLLAQQVRGRLEDLDRLVAQRTRELQEANAHLQKEIANKELMEKALRVSEEQFSKAFRASPIAMAIQRLRDQEYVDVNSQFQELTGHDRAELLGLASSPGAGFPQLVSAEMLAQLHELKSVRNQECQLLSKSGLAREVLVSLEIFDLGAEPHVLVIAQDITDRLNLENQLRQAQKMEAVGQLAAGVAHDFNNILGIIQGHAGLLLARNDLEKRVASSLEQINAASMRAATLTRQLLTFTRKQVVKMNVLDIDDQVRQLSGMMQRMIGEHISLEYEFKAHSLNVRADAASIDQVLINLAVNARDAMPKGGRLTISTARECVDEAHAARHAGARPGPHVRVTATDTGHGMTPEVLARIFEPFYTTKAVGKGTGLGLATVYGVLKQHHGWIEVSSQPGAGTSFSFFLPQVTASRIPAT